ARLRTATREDTCVPAVREDLSLERRATYTPSATRAPTISPELHENAQLDPFARIDPSQTGWRRRWIQSVLDDFERDGIHVPQETLDQVRFDMNLEQLFEHLQQRLTRPPGPTSNEDAEWRSHILSNAADAAALGGDEPTDRSTADEHGTPSSTPQNI